MATGTLLRRGAKASVALGAALGTLAQPWGAADAHQVGDHGNMHLGGGTCLEGRNHTEESHHRSTGFGAHLSSKSESTATVPFFGIELCAGIASGLPRGHLYARYQLLIHRNGNWYQCLNVAGLSTQSGQWSKTVQTDTGDKAPCVPAADRRGYWYVNRTSHSYLKNGAWTGSWLQSDLHVFHNK
jgi:hypothetical protein